MTNGGAMLWDGHWVLRRPEPSARPEGGGPEAVEARDIIGFDRLPPAAQPALLALICDAPSERTIESQIALPLPKGGHALLTVRGLPLHLEVTIRGAGPPPDPHPGDPVVLTLADGRRAELAGIAVCAIGPDGTTSSVSPALAALTRTPARTLVTEGLASVVAPDDLGRVLAVVRRATATAEGIALVPGDGGPARWVTVEGVDLEPDPSTFPPAEATDHGRLLVFTPLDARSGELARAAHRAAAAFEQAPSGRAHLDETGAILRANPALGDLVGADPADLVGRPLIDLVVPDDRAALEALATATLRGDLSGFEHEVRLLACETGDGEGGDPASDPAHAGDPAGTATPPGSDAGAGDPPPADDGALAPTDPPAPPTPPRPEGPRWVRITIEAAHLAERTVAEASVVDITSRHRAEVDQRGTVDALRTAFTHAPTPMALIGQDGLIREANAQLRTLLRLAPGQSPHLTEVVVEDDRHLITELLDDLGTDDRTIECRLQHPDGPDGVVELTISAVPSAADPGAHAIAQFRDITLQRDTEEKLLHQTLHDPLTGLGNRLLLRDRLERAAAAQPETPFALMFIDLDHFKWINDSHGHEVGDALLIEVAQRLRAAVRTDDTVARLGGDEFVVLANGVSDADTAAMLAEKVRAAVARPFVRDDRVLTVTASVGVVLTGTEHATADALLRDADQAMYRAKSAGRDAYQVTVGSSADDARAPITEALRLALDTDSLLLHHQPVVDLRSGRAVGAEALLRIHDPVAGTGPPSRLLDGVDDPELLVDLAGWVLDTVLDEVAEWDAAHIGPLSVWCNLSGAELGSDALVDRVRASLVRTGIEPRRLHLEIPEPALALTDAAALDRLRELASLGVRIGLDDFGTGTTSLAHLRALPIHFLKIDPSIGRRLLEPGGRAVVEAVVAVGRALGLDVIAEGIEDPAQIDTLVTIGCTHAQGYLFAAPAPAASMGATDGPLPGTGPTA